MKAFFIVALLFIQSWANEITITIVYGDDMNSEIIKTEYTNGMSALEVLDKVTDIKLKQVGKYTFVNSINGKQAIKGTYGWFYSVDGEKTNKLASTYKLKDNKSMKWIYDFEACY